MLAGTRALPEFASVDTLFFDVYGTLVDWRGSIAREAKAILRPLGIDCDWLAFADTWREKYQPVLNEVRRGDREFCMLDTLQEETVGAVLEDFDIKKLFKKADLRNLALAWHRLDAWKDAADGLRRLKKDFLIFPVSNGSIPSMAALARRNGFEWDAVLGAPIARDYKPSAGVYLTSAEAIDRKPEQCVMTACHSDDLIAAQKLGFRTAHIARPLEWGPGGKGESEPIGVRPDIIARDLGHFAQQLNC